MVTLEEVQLELARRNYYEYVKLCHREIYQENQFGAFVCGVLNEAIQKREQMKRGELPPEIQYLRFSVPPQHGKSMHITETLPSYFLGKFPGDGVIEVSYSESFAKKFGAKNREKLRLWGGKLFHIGLSNDTNAKDEFETVFKKTGRKTGGGMISRGVSSGVTGSSWGDLIIVDDPIKNREEAGSKTYRDALWAEWQDSISTRIHPMAIVILIMTRWHTDDIWGRLSKSEFSPEPLPWKDYVLPIEAEENDPMGRAVGEPLWPQRFGQDYILEKKKYRDTFLSLYMCRPVSREGELFLRKWWNFAPLRPSHIPLKILSVDASFDGKQTSDLVAIHVWGKKDANYYLIDRVACPMNFPATITAICNMLHKYPDISLKLIEEKANGPAILSTLNGKIGGFVGVIPKGSKVSRAQNVLAFLEAGNLFLPDAASCPWVSDFLNQVSDFPHGRHDDDVDAMSQAIERLSLMNADTETVLEKTLPFELLTNEELGHESLTEGEW